MKPKIITFANDMTAFYPAAPSDAFAAQVGHIFAANDANFDAEHLSEGLTDYIVGYRDPENLQDILDTIAPPCVTGRRFEYRVHNNREDFMDDSGDDSDIRQIGGEFAAVDSKGTKVDGATDNKGLMVVLDNDQGGNIPRVQQAKVAMLRNRLLRSEIRRSMAILEANDTAVSSNWGPSNANRDPDGDLLTMVDTSGDERGFNPNVLVLGGGAAVKRKIALRSKTAPDEVGARLTDEQLADFLGVRKVVTMNARYQSAAAAKSKILGDAAFSYFASQDATENDPSNIKRFVTMTDSGMFKVYIISNLKRTIIVVEHYSRIVATSTIGIRKQTVTYT